MKKRSIYKRLIEWEYWSFHWVYGPVYPVFAWYVIRSGFKYFFSASNPTIYSGGFLMESKKTVYDLLPDGTYPPTLYAEPGSTARDMLQRLTGAGIDFPLVLKPDIGGRGRGVVIVHDPDELSFYVPQFTLPFLAQPLIPYAQEVGIFYVKIPGEARGKVTGIVGKSFGSVTGDGLSSMEALIQMDERLSIYADNLFLQLGERISEVLAEGKKKFWCHLETMRAGQLFFNWSHLIDDRLNEWLNNLASQIDGFYYGRLDIRFHSWEEMLRNEKFSIIELNGAGSEPTHMYDPGQSIFYAWKEIIRHWRLLYKISKANRAKGANYMTLKEGQKMFSESAAYDATLDALHKKLLVKPVVKPNLLGTIFTAQMPVICLFLLLSF